MKLAVTRQERALVVALLASLLLWNLPFGGLVLYPFKLLATWLHEMSHGVADDADRRRLLAPRDLPRHQRHRVRRARRGRPGRAAIASAGYMGAALLGGLLLVLGQSGRGPRAVLLGFAHRARRSRCLFWVRNDFGMGAVAIGALACWSWPASPASGSRCSLVNFVAAQACINAVLDIRVLFRPSWSSTARWSGVSDAHNMAAATFGSHWMWAGVWLALVVRLLLRRAARRAPEARPR